MAKSVDLRQVLGSRFQAHLEDLPKEFIQLLDKLVDVPSFNVTPVVRSSRNAAGDNDEVQQSHLWHRRA